MHENVEDCDLNHDVRDPCCVEILSNAGIDARAAAKELKAIVTRRVSKDPLLAEIKSHVVSI